MTRMSRILTTTAATLALAGGAQAASHDSKAENAATASQPKAEAQAQSQTQAQAQTPTGADTQKPADQILVVTVGDKEITQGDIVDTIAMLPERMQSQPQEMLVPMVVDQLIMRELILDATKDQELGQSDAVADLMEQHPGASREDAIVHSYLRGEMDGAVSDKAVKQAYDALKQNAETDLPPLESVRPQIEQQLQQEAYAALRDELRQDVRITFYGPDGKPRAAQAETGGETRQN